MDSDYCYIYSLEIEDKRPFYVGKADDISRRHRQHLQGANKSERAGKYKFFPKEFNVVIIDRVLKSEWEFWEKHYISLYKSWGCNLLNVALGGNEGMQKWYKKKTKKETLFMGEMEKDKSIVFKLKDIRRFQKITIKEISKNTGMNRNSIGLIERGKGNPSIATIDRIAKALGCEIAIVLKR